MALTFLYPQGNKGFKRSYVSGFVGGSDTTNFVYTGVDLEFDYLAPTYHIVLRVQPWFRPWSSNFYTLDYVFDPANSYIYLGGTPIVAATGVAFHPMQTEPTWRIRVQATLAVDENYKADLPQSSSYWRQLW